MSDIVDSPHSEDKQNDDDTLPKELKGQHALTQPEMEYVSEYQKQEVLTKGEDHASTMKHLSDPIPYYQEVRN